MSIYDDTPVDWHEFFKGSVAECRPPIVDGTLEAPPRRLETPEWRALLSKALAFARGQYPEERVIRGTMDYDSFQKCHRWRVYLFPTPGNTRGFEPDLSDKEKNLLKRTYG